MLCTFGKNLALLQGQAGPSLTWNHIAHTLRVLAKSRPILDRSRRDDHDAIVFHTRGHVSNHCFMAIALRDSQSSGWPTTRRGWRAACASSLPVQRRCEDNPELCSAAPRDGHLKRPSGGWGWGRPFLRSYIRQFRKSQPADCGACLCFPEASQQRRRPAADGHLRR